MGFGLLTWGPVLEAGLTVAAFPFGSLLGLFLLGTLNRRSNATGALVGMGIPEYEAKRDAGRIEKGAILLSVHCDTSEQIKRAKEVMKNTDAEDIASSGEASADVKADRESHRTASGGSR